MKFASFFITLALLFSSCEKSNDPSPRQEEEKTGKSVNRIEKADAPSLEPDPVISNAFVGNTFAYKRIFTEVFEDHEIPRLPPPGAGPKLPRLLAVAVAARAPGASARAAWVASCRSAAAPDPGSEKTPRLKRLERLRGRSGTSTADPTVSAPLSTSHDSSVK